MDLDHAERFEATCAGLFGEALRPGLRIAEVMRAIAGGRPVTLPRATDGRQFCASTVRFLGDGDSLPGWYGNDRT